MDARQTQGNENDFMMPIVCYPFMTTSKHLGLPISGKKPKKIVESKLFDIE